MKRFLTPLVLSLALCAPFAAFAANDAGPAADAQSAAQPAVESAPHATGPAGVTTDRDDLVGQLRDVKAKYEAIKSASKGEKAVAIAGMIAAILFLIIGGIKRAAGLTKRGKKWIPWVLLGLGAIAGVAAHFAGGAGLIDSIIVGGGGPGAILVNELWKTLKK